MQPDFRLYLIADTASASKTAFASIVTNAIAGGVTCVQLRAKHLATKETIVIGQRLRQITRQYNIPFIVNDRPDVALAIDADGVHLGQNDMPIQFAQKILGKRKIIGVSAKTVAEAKKAQDSGATYLGIGPLFATTSKHDAGAPIGIAALAKIKHAVEIPIVGIGGITLTNAPDIVKARPDGIAVLSSLMQAKDPKKAAEEFIQLTHLFFERA